MSFTYEEKPSRSRFVETIWKTEDKTDGVYIAPADGCWDLIFVTQDGKTRVLFSGPTTRPTPFEYKAGNKNLGIRFKPGAFMTQVSALAMRNVVDVLAMQDARHFILFDYTFEIPSFETADQLVERLEQLGFLGNDYVVSAKLKDQALRTTDRSVQRHFLQATGLPAKSHQRIRQAQRAVDLLRSGHSPIETAHEAGYADQAHMTRTLKALTGHTPAEISTTKEPIIVEHRS
jgi:AraC-like DNA-binding protein